MKEDVASNYVVRIVGNPTELDANTWNALLDAQPSATPFMRHEYLAALHRSASATPETGWTPCFLVAQVGDEPVAFCPLYLKTHSYGEYVFDWAWADAYERHGLRYYPKLLDAVPFTPVPGPRLLARDAPSRLALLDAMQQLATQSGFSSAHLLFLDEADQVAARTAGWMMRSTVQFHWLNRTPEPYADFDEFLATLQREKRKKIQQERRRVREAGVTFTAHEGTQIDPELWDFFYRCYTLTYRAHHSTPYITRSFFEETARTMPQNWLLFVAWRNGERVAASLLGIDPKRRHAFGRYWGATEAISCLHFDACYYQPLEWCIANGYARFEGGAQGEHKMARGLMPTQTWSAHWLSDARFAHAVNDFLAREGEGVQAYVDELRERSPFKSGRPGA